MRNSEQFHISRRIRMSYIRCGRVWKKLVIWHFWYSKFWGKIWLAKFRVWKMQNHKYEKWLFEHSQISECFLWNLAMFQKSFSILRNFNFHTLTIYLSLLIKKWSCPTWIWTQAHQIGSYSLYKLSYEGLVMESGIFC